MRTTKPISTIAFNTPAYLKQKLRELQRAGFISFWAFIQHKPEDDEGGKKYHCHVYIEPSKMLQTDNLKEELKEFDPKMPDKPLGCISFSSSKFDPWYMYALHDRRFLASKSQSRRYTYSAQDIVSSDADDLNFKVKSIDLLALSPYQDMMDAQKQGVTWSEYFSRGTIPIPQIRSFQEAWNTLLQTKTDRNGRPGHDDDEYEYEGRKVDLETGELI